MDTAQGGSPYWRFLASLFDEAVSAYPHSQAELARILSRALQRPNPVSRSTILDWRLGKTAVPAPALMCAIAQAAASPGELAGRALQRFDDDPDSLRAEAAALVDLAGLFKPQAAAAIRTLDTQMRRLEEIGAFDDGDSEVQAAV
jgi:transcriptional regulator with XRE-family HTH domain